MTLTTCVISAFLGFVPGKRKGMDVARAQTTTWSATWTVLGAAAVVALAMGLPSRMALAQSSSTGEKSWTDSITSPFKQGFEKLGKALDPNPKPVAFGPEDDAISLKTKAKPGPELYVSIARLYEQSNKLAEAEQQYQLALDENRNDVPALLGYAHLKELQERPSEALQLYQRALKASPNQASVHNNVGLFYVRRKKFDDAAAFLERAVRLDPKNPLYRNNLAMVQVEQGQVREAMANLQAVHAPSAAYYNMGYLMQKKGRPQEALTYFTLAAKMDPSLDAARQWVRHLQQTTMQAQSTPSTEMPGVKVTAPPPTIREPLLSADASPRRLPPTMSPEWMARNPGGPGVSNDAATPVAPMPPTTTSTVRPLPRVY
ncbi:MAG: tetratricopeptide repeat protein [Thermoguttaceae bacterium]